MLRAISATHLVKERAGFGQTIRPLPGSVLASTALGSWDPDPDYFFHWLRDSALVIVALRHLIAEGAYAGEGISRFKEFVAFSLSLNRLDGASFLRLAGDFRKNVDPSFLQFVRDDSEICTITGDRVLGEPRFNPDATLDISKWSRPQHDGPARRALALMRFWPLDGLDDATRASMRALILTDLEFIIRHWREPCFDMWEEESGTIIAPGLCTMRRSPMALNGWRNLARTSARRKPPRRGARDRKIAGRILVPRQGLLRKPPRRRERGSRKGLDFATILAVIHAGRKGAHKRIRSEGHGDPRAARGTV